jgi:DNA-binding LytR/AlgR family response regulator
MKMLAGNKLSSPAKGYKERYIVRFNDRIVPLNVADIAYIYSEEKNNYLVTTDGQKYIIDSSLDVMNEELNPGAFFKISRSCIIAMKSIKSIIKQPGGRLRIVTTIDSHFEMTVSRSRVDDFLIWLEK